MKLYNILYLALAIGLFSCSGSKSFKPYGEVVDITEFGGVYDEVLAKEANLIALRKAINSGSRIKISGTFFTSVDKIEVEANQIFLFSENNGRIIFMNAGYIFAPRRDLQAIIIQGITFKTNYNGKGSVVLISKGAQNKTVRHLGLLDVSNNKFYGKVKARFYGSLERPILFDDITFKNNTHYNPDGGVWYFKDAGRNNVHIRENKIYNLAGTYFHFGGNNNAVFKLRDFIKGKELIENNRVINEDDFWVPTEEGYVTFVLLESNHSVYKNNHVEGVKSLYTPAIYDIYQSSKYSEYRHNTYINNFAFGLNNKSYATRALYKAKGGREKHVSHNTFILEKDMLENGVEKYNLEKEDHISLKDCWIGMISSSAATYPQDIYYENNFIDVPILRNDAIGKMSSNKLLIKNNEFHVNHFLSKFFAIDQDNYQNSRIYEVSGNKFYNDSETFIGSDKGMVNFIERRGVSKNNTDNIKLIIQNNHFKNLFFKNFVMNVSADHLIIKDNVFEGTFRNYPAVTTYLTYASLAEKQTIENNVIKSSGKIHTSLQEGVNRRLSLGKFQLKVIGGFISFNNSGGLALPEERFAYTTNLKINICYDDNSTDTRTYEIVYTPQQVAGNKFTIHDKSHNRKETLQLDARSRKQDVFRMQPALINKGGQPLIYLKKIKDVWQVLLDTDEMDDIQEIELTIETKKI